MKKITDETGYVKITIKKLVTNEELEELKEYYEDLIDESDGRCLSHWEEEQVISLITDEQQRRAVRSEEVSKAIDYFQSDFDYQTGCDCENCKKAKQFFALAIQALKSHQPKGENNEI
jgi:hypothetical protein